MAHRVFLVALCLVIAVFQAFTTSVVGISLEDEDEVSVSSSYFDELSKLTKYKFKIKEAASGIYSKNYDDTHSNNEGWQLYFQEMMHVYNILHDGQSRISFFKKFDLLSHLEKIESNSNKKETSPPSSCINDTGLFITSLLSGDYKNHPWAFQFLDAAGKPGPSISKGWLNFVGSYDQCKEARATEKNSQFHGRYFTLPITIPRSPIPAKIGICFPSTCSSIQMTSIFQELFSAANITKYHVGYAIESSAETKVTAATIVAIIILVVLGSLAILGTFYDVLVVQRIANLIPSHVEVNGKNSESNSLSNEGNDASAYPANENLPLIPKAVIVETSPNVAGQILLAFSFYSNGKKILNTSQPAGSLGSIHGIRFLSMTWVVLGHCYAFGAMSFTFNMSTEFPILLHRWTFGAVVNALVSVDTFFTLSGLLTSYVTLQALWRHGLKINWAKFYFHRFWRLTPPYMFALVIVLGLQQYLGGEGPFWSSEQPADKKFCEKNWWTNLLYVNNLVGGPEYCFGHSWYLANDMQFFVISPIMLIPFYFHWTAGVTSCTCVLLISWITTGVLSYQNDWGATILSAMMTKNHWFDHYYIVPWCRIGPYVIGILAGYVLAVFKERPFRMRRWAAVVGWLVATGSALAVLYGLHGDISGEHPSTRSFAALYNTVGRSVWGACVCWVIIACAMGYGGPINTILSWSPFVTLGRLTYMTYLIHLCILQVFFSSMGSLYYMNDTILPVMFLGLLVFCNMAAFVGVLLLESPMIGLEKVLLRKESQN